MKYKWILFDADDTLFEFDAYAGLKLMFSRYAVNFMPQDYEDYQRVNAPLWIDYQNGKISAIELQNTRFAIWSNKLGISAIRLNNEFMHSMADICLLLPGAQKLIDALNGKVNMGIITNGFTALQTIRLERTGLKNIFFPLITSEQAGVAKPDVNIFEYAFNLMNHPPKNQILMVGDNPYSDIQGGINAGIDTCWLNINSHDKPDGIEPSYQIRSLLELQQLLFS